SALSGSSLGADFDRRVLRAGPVCQAPLEQLLLQGCPARLEGHSFRLSAGRPRGHRADHGQQPLTAPDGQLGLAALVQKSSDGKLLHPIVTGGRALASVPTSPLSRAVSPPARPAGPAPRECPRADSAAPRRTSRTACPPRRRGSPGAA